MNTHTYTPINTHTHLLIPPHTHHASGRTSGRELHLDTSLHTGTLLQSMSYTHTPSSVIECRANPMPHLLLLLTPTDIAEKKVGEMFFFPNSLSVEAGEQTEQIVPRLKKAFPVQIQG